ncbi:MAG: IS5 family transposase [Shewanella sp.]
MAKAKYKINNWKQYNQALINRGSITFWIDEAAIQGWHNTKHHGKRGRDFTFANVAIETALTLKGIFKLPLRALQGFLDSIFALMNVPLKSPSYSCISKRAKTVNISYRLPSRGPVAHIVIDSTGLKVFGEGEWKVRKHGQQKRRVWRKLHLAVDPSTHEVVSAAVSLNSVSDSQVLPELLNSSCCDEIKQVSADGAYDTRDCYQTLINRGITAAITPRGNAIFWEEGHPRNDAVEALKSGQLEKWKRDMGYHQRSLSETAMYRYKQLLSPKLTMRDYCAQVGEALANVKVMNKIIGLGMPMSYRVN